jgi:hypothetical protein
MVVVIVEGIEVSYTRIFLILDLLIESAVINNVVVRANAL